MSIQFYPVFNDGRKLDIFDFCFRELSKASPLARSPEERATVNDLLHGEIEHAVVHWVPMDSTETEAVDFYTEETVLIFMKEVIEAVPFARTVLQARMHPTTKKTYVTALTGDLRCDKTMTALFLVRNLFYLDGSSKLYRLCRGRGLTPLASVLIGSLFYHHIGFGGAERVYLRTNGEYNLFNDSTFGRQGTINFLTHDESWDVWRQGTWKDQRHYKRDWMMDEEFNFKDFDGFNVRSILDCFSVPDDDQYWFNNDDGYTMGEVIELAERIFFEAGVKFRE